MFIFAPTLEAPDLHTIIWQEIQQKSGILLATAYLPNTDYFRLLLSGKPIVLEKHEHYRKQSYRNRCVIYSANGPLVLSIPVIKQSLKEPIGDKRISYAENWQNQHWRAIASAYKNSPYFEYFEDEFRPFYEKEFEFLFDYNLQLLQCILKILRQSPDLTFTEMYQKSNESVLDVREQIDPKKKTLFEYGPYYQVFSEKHGFIPNLSVIDLLFHEGINSLKYLQAIG
ncbi:MAG: WbqC family protein [Bacteroidetes bacterium]|nr:WbqC family protein [Bacteroidota bacterium]